MKMKSTYQAEPTEPVILDLDETEAQPSSEGSCISFYDIEVAGFEVCNSMYLFLISRLSGCHLWNRLLVQ